MTTRKRKHRKRKAARSQTRARVRQSKNGVPTTLRQYFSMPRRKQEIMDSLAHVISDVRNGVPLRRAAKEYGIPLATVLELGRSALRKKNRKYVATETDQLLRVLPILKRNGKQ